MYVTVAMIAHLLLDRMQSCGDRAELFVDFRQSDGVDLSAVGLPRELIDVVSDPAQLRQHRFEIVEDDDGLVHPGGHEELRSAQVCFLCVRVDHGKLMIAEPDRNDMDRRRLPPVHGNPAE